MLNANTPRVPMANTMSAALAAFVDASFFSIAGMTGVEKTSASASAVMNMGVSCAKISAFTALTPLPKLNILPMTVKAWVRLSALNTTKVGSRTVSPLAHASAIAEYIDTG